MVKIQQKNMKVTELKLEDDWEAFNRIAKVESLHRGIEVIRQSHNAEVERKNAVLQVFEAGLDDAENQFSSAVKLHSANLDDLIDLHSKRLLTMKRAFEEELEEMQTAFQDDGERIEKMHDEEVVGILRLISAVKNKEEEASALDDQDLQQVRMEIQNQNLEKLNMLRTQLEAKAQNINEQLNAVDSHYNETTMELSAEFKQMTVNDEKLRDEIGVKSNHIERLQAALRRWRDKMNHNIQENDFRNDFLTKKIRRLANQNQVRGVQ